MTAICNTQAQVPQNSESIFSILADSTRKISKLVKRQYVLHQKNRTNRRAFQQMLQLEGHILSDIGVTHGDVLWASKLPLEVNAAHELEKIRTLAKRSKSEG